MYLLKRMGLGIRQSLKTCESLIGLDLSNDKRTLRGIMQGEKVNAHFTLTHRKPSIVQATTIFQNSRVDSMSYKAITDKYTDITPYHSGGGCMHLSLESSVRRCARQYN
jgi:hypothetical protein